MQPYQLNAELCKRTGEVKHWLNTDVLLELLDKQQVGLCIAGRDKDGLFHITLEYSEPVILVYEDGLILADAIALAYIRLDDARKVYMSNELPKG